MTDKKLSQLPLGSAVAQIDLWYADQGGASVAQTGTAMRSYVWPEYIDVMNPIYGIVLGTGLSSGQRITNGTGLNTASADAGAAGKIIKLPVGTIEYTATATDTSVNTGFQVDYRAAGCIGGGPFVTKLVQFALNHPCITLASLGAGVAANFASYGGFSCGHGVDQTGQSMGHGVLLGGSAFCRYENIYVNPGISGLGIKLPYNGFYSPSMFGNIFFFENWLNNITIKGGANSLLSMQANSTGNTWGVTYIGGPFGAFYTNNQLPASYAVDLENHGDGVFNELNIEWINNSGDSLIAIFNSRGTTFNQIRLEGNMLGGFNPRIFNLALVNLVINRLDLYDCTIQAAGGANPITGTPTIVSAFGDVHLWIGGGYWQWNAAADGNGAATTPFTFFVQNSGAGLGASESYIEAHNIYLAGNNPATFSFDSSIPNSVTGDVYQFGKYIWNQGISRVEDPKIFITSGATTYNLYGWAIRPRVIVNYVLTAALTITWKDTWGAAGLPAALPTSSPDILGLYRTAAATGAFNVLLKDGAGTTITTQTTATMTNFITRNGVTLTNF